MMPRFFIQSDICFTICLNFPERVVSELGKLSLIISKSNKSCYDQNVKLAENLSSILSNDVPRVITVTKHDRDALENTMKDLKFGLMMSISNASNKIATGEM